MRMAACPRRLNRATTVLRSAYILVLTEQVLAHSFSFQVRRDTGRLRSRIERGGPAARRGVCPFLSGLWCVVTLSVSNGLWRLGLQGSSKP